MSRPPRESHPVAIPGDPFLLYTSEDGRTRLEVHLRDETVWLSLNQMADLFQRDKSTIQDSVVADFASTCFKAMNPSIPRKNGLATQPRRLHTTDAICSPLDQPKGPRRGFDL